LLEAAAPSVLKKLLEPDYYFSPLLFDLPIVGSCCSCCAQAIIGKEPLLFSTSSVSAS